MLPIASGISAGDQIASAIAAHLDRTAAIFDDQLRSDLPPVAALVRHVEAYRGKMLRPTLVGLCGIATTSDTGADSNTLLTRNHALLGAVVEMVHMATLVHDDVLDEADTRRRGLTVNRLRGNEPAVILGDYLIASAYHLCSQLQDQRASLIVAEASMVMCAGELLQLHHRDDYSLDEPTYYEIVARKTAALIAAACRLGAACSGADTATCERLGAYGRRLGIAFQIQDDLLDLTGEEAVVGKSLGKDLEKGKLTLPLIHHLSTCKPADRGHALVLLEEAGEGHEQARDAAQALRRALDSTNSLDYARATAKRLVHEAKAELAGLSASPAKSGLLQAADAVIERNL